MSVLELDTPHGPARVSLRLANHAMGALVLGHGAGGGVETPDLTAAARVARSVGFSVGLVEQPYRVAGRRSQAPAAQLDASWLAVVAQLREGALGELPLVVGGRSAGARVACRTAAEAGAVAVLCLAFPLHPPGKADDPSRSRAGELRSAGVPVLVINGDRDPFGIPDEADADRLIVLPGETHSLSRHPHAITDAVASWLAQMTGSLRPGSVAG